MSRIGKKPVAVPQGVTASVNGQTVSAHVDPALVHLFDAAGNALPR